MLIYELIEFEHNNLLQFSKDAEIVKVFHNNPQHVIRRPINATYAWNQLWTRIVGIVSLGAIPTMLI